MTTRVHISLPVNDLDAAVAFYERLLGREVTKRRPGYANFRLDEPPIHLALESHAGGVPHATAHSHFGIDLPDAGTFSTWRERLRDVGAEARDEHDVVCCFAKADKLWLTDPDGHRWEIWVRKEEVEAMGGCCEPECCAA